MPGRLKKILLLSGLLACAGLAAFVRPAEKEVSARAPASLAAPAAAGLAFRPEPQHRYTYSFRRRIELRGFANQMPSVAYRGKFLLDVIRVTDSGFTAVAQSVVEEYRGKAPPLVHLSFDRTGREVTVRTEPAPDEETRQYVAITKDLVALWDFAAETDTLGAYEARVEELPAANGSLVRRKTKLRYLTQTDTDIVSSRHWLRWDEALGLPAEVKGEERTRLGKSGTTLDSTAAYHLRFEGKSAVPDHPPARLAKLTHAETLVLAAAKATDNPEYAQVDWGSLAEQLRRLDALKPGEQLAAFGDLVRLLKRDPSALAKALALLSAKDIRAGADSGLFKTVVGALATAGSPGHQRALLALYRDQDCGVSGKGVILTALTTTQAPPTGETTDFLVREVRAQASADLAGGAAYALGSGLQSGDNEDARNALLQLWRRAERSGDVNAELSALDAIGNSGRREFFPILSAILEGEQAALRPKAAFSLRFMNTDESRGALVAQLGHADDSIRAAAVGAVALAPWAEQFRAPIQACRSHEAVEEIRKACDEILRARAQVAGN